MNLTPNAARLGVLFSCTLGGTSYLVGKIAMREVGPFTLTATRFLLSALILIVTCYLTRTRISVSTWRDAAIPAVAFTLAMLFLLFGLKTSSSSVAAFLANSDAILIPIVDWVLFRRKVGKGTVIPLLIGVAGLAALTIRSDLSIAQDDSLVLCSALFFALYYSLNQSIVPRHSALALTGVSQLICALVALPFAVCLEEFPRQMSDLSQTTWTAILYSGLILSGFRFWMMMRMQFFLTAAQIGLMFLIEPVVGALIGITFAGERLTSIQWVGAVLIVLAISLPFLQSRRKAALRAAVEEI